MKTSVKKLGVELKPALIDSVFMAFRKTPNAVHHKSFTNMLFSIIFPHFSQSLPCSIDNICIFNSQYHFQQKCRLRQIGYTTHKYMPKNVLCTPSFWMLYNVLYVNIIYFYFIWLTFTLLSSLVEKKKFFSFISILNV